MQLNEKIGAVEAILFASGEPVEEKRISEAAVLDKGSIAGIVKTLNNRYDDNGSALKIVRLGTSYQMCTREEYAEYIRSAIEYKKQIPLSNAAMEALTVIAYNQPVTKGFVENVRGIDSSSVINSLVEKELLEESGRLDVPGRPVAYKTTENFLRCFGLSSLDDLPPLVREDTDSQTSLFDEESGDNDYEEPQLITR
ncbi:MAG: SMC-Scp complex subunit ScpB [Oscillospiraceae bacterium]